MQGIFIKKFFSVYDGTCLSCEMAHNWVEKFSHEHLLGLFTDYNEKFISNPPPDNWVFSVFGTVS
jgi:hypothetical protein